MKQENIERLAVVNARVYEIMQELESLSSEVSSIKDDCVGDELNNDDEIAWSNLDSAESYIDDAIEHLTDATTSMEEARDGIDPDAIEIAEDDFLID